MPVLFSTAISRIDYDPYNRRLYVSFRGGKSYTYYDVPREEYEALRTARSPGAYLNDHIKDRYRVRQVATL